MSANAPESAVCDCGYVSAPDQNATNAPGRELGEYGHNVVTGHEQFALTKTRDVWDTGTARHKVIYNDRRYDNGKHRQNIAHGSSQLR